MPPRRIRTALESLRMWMDEYDIEEDDIMEWYRQVRATGVDVNPTVDIDITRIVGRNTPETRRWFYTMIERALEELREIQEANKENEPPPVNRRAEGSGVLKRDVGTLPPKVRTLLEQVKDEKVTSVQAWRYPLMKSLQNIIKKVVTLPYDSIFHLGLNLNAKYNLEKDVLIKFTKGKERGDTAENTSAVYPVTKDITFGELFDGLRKKMGNDLTEYDARTNNCQDFSLAILSVLGVSDAELKKFIKQDADKIFKSAGVFESLAETAGKLSTLKEQVVDRLTQGEGRSRIEGGCDCSKTPMVNYDVVKNGGYPMCKILI